MSLARVHNFAISLDGFGTGEGQNAELHFGHAGQRLHEWMFATEWWGARGEPTGTGGVDDAFAQQNSQGIGAEIMGAGKYAHPGWHEDPDWKGAWGPNPPFHSPVFVLTHHVREPIEMEGGTTFNFLDTSPAEALEIAREAAGGLERLGGRGVEEVVRRAALHLDRRARVMGEDEDRGVERRVGTPRALPVRVLVPAGVPELPGTHDLGADPGIELLGEGVVDAAAPAGLPPAGGEHPFVQPIPGVTEMQFGALALPGAEAVE